MVHRIVENSMPKIISAAKNGMSINQVVKAKEFIGNRVGLAGLLDL